MILSLDQPGNGCVKLRQQGFFKLYCRAEVMTEWLPFCKFTTIFTLCVKCQNTNP